MPGVKKRPATVDHVLPDDLLIEIFLKLPVRSLFLFRSVCKHWLSLIQNPTFVTLHFNRPLDSHIMNNNNHQPMLILRTVKHETDHTYQSVLTLLSNDENLPYKYDFPLELVSPSMASRCLDHFMASVEFYRPSRSNLESRLRLLGPCNGLFCLTDRVDLMLINPATRQCMQLSPPSDLTPKSSSWYQNCKSKGDDHYDCVSFGFDSVSNDYKVVRFNIQKKSGKNYNGNNDYAVDDAPPPPHPHNHHVKVDIYCLSTHCWRALDRFVLAPRFCEICSHSLFFNGAFHWLVGGSILVFDLNKEAFNLFELPKWCFRYHVRDKFLLVLDESLSVVVRRPSMDVPYRIETWVMMEYGSNNYWNKLNLNPNFDRILRSQRPLSFGEKEELFIENKWNGKLSSLNLETRKTKEFQVQGVPRTMFAFRYREILISLT